MAGGGENRDDITPVKPEAEKRCMRSTRVNGESRCCCCGYELMAEEIVAGKKEKRTERDTSPDAVSLAHLRPFFAIHVSDRVFPFWT